MVSLARATSLRFYVIFGAFVALGLFSPAIGQAQSTLSSGSHASTKSLADSLSGEAKSEYTSAKLLFGDGDLAGAAVKFGRAYELSSEPRLLWNMAVCEKEQRHYARASTLVSRYLSEGGSVISSEERTQAQATLASLKEFSSEIELEGVPDGATISVDGVEVGTSPLESKLYLDLGTRELEVSMHGHEPWKKTIKVPGNNKIVVPIELDKATLTARLTVLTGIESSVITIDGQTLGSGRWDGTLAAAKHHLRVTAPGKKSYELDFELTANGSRTMDVALRDKKSSPWPWIIGGAAVVAGASVGGYFLFREKKSEVKGPEGDWDTLPLRGRFGWDGRF